MLAILTQPRGPLSIQLGCTKTDTEGSLALQLPVWIHQGAAAGEKWEVQGGSGVPVPGGLCWLATSLHQRPGSFRKACSTPSPLLALVPVSIPCPLASPGLWHYPLLISLHLTHNCDTVSLFNPLKLPNFNVPSVSCLDSV